MAFLGPDPTGVAGPVLGATHLGPPDTGLPLIAQNKPNAIKALTRKYSGDNLPAVQKLYGHDIVNNFVKWEMDRAQRGISPATAEQTMAMLQSAKTRQAATAPPDRDPTDILGNVASDVGNIVMGIPKMPVQIAHDIVHLPEVLPAIESGDPTKILQAPGIRLIPGAYTASNLLQGNISELASHPVMTGLDVLPYAAKGLKMPVGDEGATVGSKIAESSLGEGVGRARDALKRSLPGQLVRQTFGADTRDVARILAEQSAIMHQSAVPQMASIYKSGLDRLLQAGTEAQQHINTAIPDVMRQGQIKSAIEDPQSVGATDMQSALDAVRATDAERGAALAFKSHADALQQYGLDAGMIHQRTVLGQNEIYTTRAAQKIDAGRSKLGHSETVTNLRNAVIDPSSADLDAIGEMVHRSLQDDALKLKQKRTVAAGYVHALDAAGYDTSSMLADVSRANKSNIAAAMFDSNGDLRAVPGSGEIRTRPRTGIPALDSRTRWLEDNKTFTPKAHAKLQDQLGARESRILPARWQPAFQRIKVDAAHNYIEQNFNATDPQVPQLLENVHQHMYSDLGKDTIRTINNEVLQTVNELRQQGIDPEFVHHVSPDQERALSSLSVTTLVPKASQYGVRINDWTPSADSLSVSLSHQGLELARQRGSRVALEQIRDAHAVPVRDATAELRPIAERAAARSGRSYGEELERVMRKQYVRWSETENGFVAGNAKPFRFSAASYAPDELVIPRHLARSLEMLAKPPTYSRIFDPYLKVFRTAILPFSPRFLVHHIGGGMLAGVLEDPRIVAQIPQGMAFSRDIAGMNKAMVEGRDYQLADATRATLERMPDSMRAEINGLKYGYEPENSYRMKAGGKLGELAHAAGIDRIAKAGGRIGDWTFDTVDMMDTMYRAAAYLSGEKSALTEGLSAEEAGARGRALVDKVMPRWLEQTPMERSALRVAFPFYGFMSHIMRYAFRYPIDHPWRTSTIAAVSRAELNDFGTGLPQALAHMLFVGNTGINLSAINPFHAVGDNLTVAGFLGQTNPLFKGALEQLGYDPVAQGPNIYPEVEYDPETGKLKARQPNAPGILGEAVTGLIPQANILAAITGTSGDFRGLMESNPDAANRMLQSAAGIPLLWRKYNLNEEAFQSELTRSTSTKQVLSDAMRTGDYSQAMRYPSLRGTVRALQKLNAAGKLKPYDPGVTPSLAANNARQQGSSATTAAEVRVG